MWIVTLRYANVITPLIRRSEVIYRLDTNMEASIKLTVYLLS